MIYYNLADQGFKSSSRASLGVYNLSLQLGVHLAKELSCTYLINSDHNEMQQVPCSQVKEVRGGVGGIRRILWDQWRLFSSVKTDTSDWIFLPKGFSSFVRKPPCRLAVYIHDVVYDYWRSSYPGYRSPLLHAYFDWSLRASLRNADIIFTNSAFTRDELVRIAENKRIKRIAPIVKAGIGFDHLKSSDGEDEKSGILIYVSAWPHKATASLIKMVERWQAESRFSDPIYFLGTLPAEVEMATFSNWKIMQTLPEEAYRNLLKKVRCTIFNSEYEGFGMPPGESLLQGAVPVYSSISATEEVMNGMGFSYENNVYESFSVAMNSALNVSRSQIEQWKKAFMMQHNWAKVIHTIKQAMADGI